MSVTVIKMCISTYTNRLCMYFFYPLRQTYRFIMCYGHWYVMFNSSIPCQYLSEMTNICWRHELLCLVFAILNNIFMYTAIEQFNFVTIGYQYSIHKLTSHWAQLIRCEYAICVNNTLYWVISTIIITSMWLLIVSTTN